MIEIDENIFENTAVAFAPKTNSELQKAKWLFSLIGNNKLVSVGTSLADIGLKLHLPLSPLFRFTVYDHFCGGETFGELVGFLIPTDEDHALAEAYGAWREKMNYGRTYMGIQRSTFIIDKQGILRKVWASVKVDQHAEKVLDFIKGI